MKTMYLRLLLLSLSCFPLLTAHADNFTPGSGGTLNNLPSFTETSGKFGGFLVTNCQRWTVFSGTRAEANMAFLPASSYGANSITLQIKGANDTWQDYIYDNAPLTTTGDNFSVGLTGNEWFRIKINGGPKDGWVSNEQYAVYSNIETYFSSWSMDESMYLTGTMSPWVGRGIETSFGVKKLSDGTIVENGLTYQWYRVNPATYEYTPIPNATTTSYTTTVADVGYKLLIKATGDGTTVGGFQQIMSSQGVLYPNKAYTTNLTSSGFNLNLLYSVPSLTINELELRDKDGEKVEIISVSPTNNPAVYQIATTLSEEKSPYYLINNNYGWMICNEMIFEGGQHVDIMPGINFSLTSTGNNSPMNNLSISATNRQINIQSDSKIKSVLITDISGKTYLRSEPNDIQFTHKLDTNITGIMIVKCVTERGNKTQKVIVQ